MKGGPRDLAVTPVTDLDVDPEPSAGGGTCVAIVILNNISLNCLLLQRARRKQEEGFHKRRALEEYTGTQIDSLWVCVCFCSASVFLLRLKETSRRKRFAPLRGLECGEEIIRALRETKELFAGVCDSTHQHGIN